MDSLIKAILKKPTPINPIRDLVRKKFKEDMVECILDQAISKSTTTNTETLKLLLERTIHDDPHFQYSLEIIIKTLKKS